MNIVHIGEPVNKPQIELELHDKIEALIYEYAGIMTVSQAVGILHLCAHELMRDAEAQL